MKCSRKEGFAAARARMHFEEVDHRVSFAPKMSPTFGVSLLPQSRVPLVACEALRRSLYRAKLAAFYSSSRPDSCYDQAFARAADKPLKVDALLAMLGRLA